VRAPTTSPAGFTRRRAAAERCVFPHVHVGGRTCASAHVRAAGWADVAQQHSVARGAS
jgi:hypothetical protein